MRREVTNLRSPRAKAVRRLAKRSFRQRDRRFLAEGPQAVGSALSVPGALLDLFITAEAEQRHRGLVSRADESGVGLYRVSGEVMAELAQTVTPQGVLGVCRFVDIPLQEAVAAGPVLATVLAHARDPGNAGTILRTADAAGSDMVVFTDSSVDPYNGKCVRASAGSLFHVPVVAGVPVHAAVRALREAGLRIVAADGSAQRTLDDGLVDGLLDVPTAWVFGNEAWGLPDDVLGLADDVVRVPIYGKAESLNLAIAAGVCLYASARVRREAGRPGR